MLVWSLIFVVISIALMMGSFLDFPVTFYHLFPVVTLLASLGMLYRIFYKSRQGARERFTDKIARLEQELAECQKKLGEKCE